jgi:NADH:ubiquinone oxidoreductase subunit 4 (subunit M)
MMGTVLALLVLAALVLLAGAVLQWRRGERRKAMLMAFLALVAAINVGIWTLPDATGEAPVDKLDRQPTSA